MKELKGFTNFRDSFKTKQVKFGGYAALITAAFAAGLILINLIAGQTGFQADLTANKLFSLSDQTLKIVDDIKAPVNIYGLWAPGQENSDVLEVLDLYTGRNKNIHYQAIDPDKNPGFLVKYDREKNGISRGSVIVEGGKAFRVIPPQDMYETAASQSGGYNITGVSIERRVTGALLYAASGETPAVYELTGHGETSLASIAMNDMIERENYRLAQMNLIQAGAPADASAIVMYTPKSDLTRMEADRLLAYLEQGGRFLVMVDYRCQSFPLLNEVLASYGLRFDYGVVMENDASHSAGNLFLEIPVFVDHEITKPLLEGNSRLITPFAMGLSFLETRRRSVGIFPLLASSADSWLRTDVTNGSPGRAAQDIRGPLTIAAAAADPEYAQSGEKQARVAAVGCGFLLDALTDQGQNPANLDFFMNCLTWLEDRGDPLSIRAKSLFLLPMRMNGLEMIVFTGLFAVLIPLAFFVTGRVVYLRRRHL
jgi:hypothetical protein